MCLYSSAHIWKSSATMRYVYLLCHFSEFQAILSDLYFSALQANPRPFVEGSGEGSRKPWCKAKSGSTGSGEGSGERARSGSTGFRRRFRRRSGRLWCRARSGSTGFRRRFRRRCGRLWCRARSGSTGFRRRFRRRSGRLWRRARSGSTGFRRRFRRRSGRLWRRARSGSTGFRRRFRRRFQEALVQSQVKFNGSGEGCRSQARSGSFNSRKPSWGVSRAWLRSTLQKDL